MNEESKQVVVESGKTARRRFLHTAGRVAVAAPAVAVLFAATQKNAMAQVAPYQTPPGNPTGGTD